MADKIFPLNTIGGKEYNDFLRSVDRAMEDPKDKARFEEMMEEFRRAQATRRPR